MQRAVALLDKTEVDRRPVRLLGAGVYNFESLEKSGDDENPQLSLEA